MIVEQYMLNHHLCLAQMLLQSQITITYVYFIDEDAFGSQVNRIADAVHLLLAFNGDIDADCPLQQPVMGCM